MRSLCENLKFARKQNFEFFFCQKIRQIEVRSALLSQTVNKLSRVFLPFLNFDIYMLNSCLKPVGTPGIRKNYLLHIQNYLYFQIKTIVPISVKRRCCTINTSVLLKYCLYHDVFQMFTTLCCTKRRDTLSKNRKNLLFATRFSSS